jgi:hypothetical protein
LDFTVQAVLLWGAGIVILVTVRSLFVECCGYQSGIKLSAFRARPHPAMRVILSPHLPDLAGLDRPEPLPDWVEPERQECSGSGRQT